MVPKNIVIKSERSWLISSNVVELAVTEEGGQMAPVTFYKSDPESIQPYYVNPWNDEAQNIEEPVLGILRGDFFCLPFGGDNRDGEKNHRVHGETSYGKWEYISCTKHEKETVLELLLRTKIREGKITKRISLYDDQNCVYIQHKVEGWEGFVPLGHHATLNVPDLNNAIRIETSPFLFGMVNPGAKEKFAGDEYCSLKAGEMFHSLERVPTIWKDPPFDDCSSFPRREGFADIIQIFNISEQTPAWVAASVPSEGYLWFSLKKPEVLPSTVIWMENHGRHGSPWNGRNRSLGLEDVCAYFAEGLNASAEPNIINLKGIPTTFKLSKEYPSVIRYIEGVVKIPPDFDRVKTVSFDRGVVFFTSVSGFSVTTEVFYDFLETGKIRK